MAEYAHIIRRYARNAGLTNDDAEEVTSRVLVALTTALRELRYDPARRFRGYLRTAVVNGARRLARERNRHPGDRATGTDSERDQLARVASRDPLIELGDQIEADLNARLRLAQQVINQVRASVTPSTWQAYWQTAVDELPAREVAERLGKSIGAVYTAKSRVIVMLEEAGRRLLDGTHDQRTSCHPVPG
ncbi:MAG: sigma-70 family RNA polymerase sigma factor [Gemmataceae bacterium]|nr:sigma-70 family RNA polymerase sigma factor [Gemmataceae bacterium]